MIPRKLRLSARAAAFGTLCACGQVQWQVYDCRARIEREAVNRRQREQETAKHTSAHDDRHSVPVRSSAGPARAVSSAEDLPSKTIRFGVGTQNIMDGCRLDGLLGTLTTAQVTDFLDILCIQENVLTPRENFHNHADRIAHHLGYRPPHNDKLGVSQATRLYCCHRHHEAPRLATIYDSAKLKLVGSALIRLPLLDPVPCVELPAGNS